MTGSKRIPFIVYLYLYFLIWSFRYHHHVVPLARISLTLSRHFSLSFIASGRSSGLHPVSSHSCWMYVRAGRPAFGRPYVGVYRSTSLMSSSLFLQQCPACLVRLTCVVFVMGGRWPYSWCLVGCCRQVFFSYISQEHSSKRERNSATGVRNHMLRRCSPACLSLRHGYFPILAVNNFWTELFDPKMLP